MALKKEEILEEWLLQVDTTHFKEGHYMVIKQAMEEYKNQAIEVMGCCVTTEDRNEQYIEADTIEREEAFNSEVEQLFCEDCKGFGSNTKNDNGFNEPCLTCKK